MSDDKSPSAATDGNYQAGFPSEIVCELNLRPFALHDIEISKLMIWEIVSMAISHTDSPDRVSLAADIVEAYVSNNSVRSTDLAALITSVHTALTNLGAVNTVPQPEPELVPAVSVKKSITPEYLICLDDGKKLKSLKRHLGSLGMTPAEYRRKWGLPKDYPMVASDYAAKRSAMAKKIGLGRLREDTGSQKSGGAPEAVAENAKS